MDGQNQLSERRRLIFPFSFLKFRIVHSVSIHCRAGFFVENSDNKKFETQVKDIIRTLRADAGAREKPPTPKL
jgi:hypothetical protein